MGGGRRKIPIYGKFMEDFSDPRVAKHATFVTPDGFVKGGQQLEQLRSSLSENSHLSRVTFHQDKVFRQSVNAAITTFDNTAEHDSIDKTIVHADGTVESGTLDWRYRDVIINTSKEYVRNLFETKVVPVIGDRNMSRIIPGWAPFGLNTKCYKSNKDNFKLEPDGAHRIAILVGEDKRDFYYINPDDDFSYDGSDGRIEFVKLENADKYKVAFPKAGTVDNAVSRTWILGPNQIHTDKYLCVFADTLEEAENMQKYFNSDFYRSGLASKMTGWNRYRDWHSFVPITDPNPATSDIDWSESSESISDQMYRKFGFTAADVAMIHKFLGQHEKSSFVDDSELDSVIAAASPSLYTVSDTLGDTADDGSVVDAGGVVDSVVGEAGVPSGGDSDEDVVSDDDVAVDGDGDIADGGECVE